MNAAARDQNGKLDNTTLNGNWPINRVVSQYEEPGETARPFVFLQPRSQRNSTNTTFFSKILHRPLQIASNCRRIGPRARTALAFRCAPQSCPGCEFSARSLDRQTIHRSAWAKSGCADYLRAVQRRCGTAEACRLRCGGLQEKQAHCSRDRRPRPHRQSFCGSRPRAAAETDSAARRRASTARDHRCAGSRLASRSGRAQSFRELLRRWPSPVRWRMRAGRTV